MDTLPTPPKESIIYEDDRLYVCLASYPLAKGHTVVVWKDDVPDLNFLEREDYEYLMDTVESARNALLKALGVEKVYLVYMDETKHVHWHLVPRFIEEGFNVFLHEPSLASDFSLAPEIRKGME
ncbi:MAG TPA: HIT family protein [Candidatus Paceibacterota bacterium]